MRKRWNQSGFGGAMLAICFAVCIAGCGGEEDDFASRFTNYKGMSGFGPGPIDEDAAREFTTTKSGLKYRIVRRPLQKGPGPRDGVIMHYRGWLENGREFESTYHDGQPQVKLIDQLLPGWKEAVELIGPGGMIELEIPPELGFGDKGRPEIGIPPNAVLYVWIELMEVVRFQNSPGPTDKDAPEEYTRTDSGLQYRILRRAEGTRAVMESEIELHFRGTLEDGTEIANTYAKGFPKRMLVKNFDIPGLVEGLLLIPEGGMIELLIPPELGYGNRRQGLIPPNSPLKFQVELNKVRGYGIKSSESSEQEKKK